MIAVIFEVTPAPGHREAYLAAAARMRPLVEKIDGFISVERFESLNPGKLISSLSGWRDEARWRKAKAPRVTAAAANVWSGGAESYFEADDADWRGDAIEGVGGITEK